MKKVIFTLFVALTVTSTNYCAVAQIIGHHVVEKNKTWHYKASNPDVNPEYYREWGETYSLEGDTIIDSHQCLKLYYTNNDPNKSCNHFYLGALFEEGEKVYCIKVGSTTPALLYNFSCEQGTTIQVSSHMFIINERKLVKYRDEYLTVIDWSPMEYGDIYDDYHYFWIEGIGSEIDFMNETPVWWDGCIWKELVTCKLNGQIIYDKDEFWTSAQFIKENEVTFTAGQIATIILPTEPDASKGKYYRLDRYEDGQIIFEQELQPQAHIPYIIMPNEDFSIDLSTLDLAGCYRDTVSVDGISFIGSYVSETFDYPDGFYIDFIDITHDCRFEESCVIGALRAYLLVRWDDPYNQGGTRVPPLNKRGILLRDYETGITSPIGETGEATLYDLQGRMLPSKPAQGIYIKNRQKVMVK